jgi:molybdate transport system ATP-binding protein
MELRAAFAKRFHQGMTIQAEFGFSLETFSIHVLFGPSGCGKTTVLRCLAGLEAPDAGWIRVGEESWCEGSRLMTPAARRIGLVAQDCSLFPHLNVVANIGFGIRGVSAVERQRRIGALVELAGLEGLEKRRPAELSGGQRQRVALARALAPRPRLLLLDEPFAALDLAGREQLRQALKDMLRESGIPTVLVTHDGAEALSLGDRFLMMQAGSLRPHPASDLRDIAERQPGRLTAPG